VGAEVAFQLICGHLFEIEKYIPQTFVRKELNFQWQIPAIKYVAFVKIPATQKFYKWNQSGLLSKLFCKQ